MHHNFVSSCEMGDRALNIVEVYGWCKALDIPWLEFAAHLGDLLESIEEKPSRKN
jgi:hypothetical protein